MDLKALVETHETVANQRKKLGQNYCEQGYQCLFQAEETGYQNKGLLKEASSLFIRAIRQERTHVEPYIGLGYLLLLISDFDNAEKQLKGALRLDPGNTDAEALLSFLYKKKTGTLPEYEKVPDPEEPLNYNQLFDKAEKFIQEQILLWAENPPPIPAIESDDLEALQSKEGQLNELCQRLNREFDVIEQEIDSTPLKNLARPLYQWHHYHRKMLTVSTSYKNHKQTLDAMMLNVKMAILQLQEAADISEIKSFEAENMDRILDECDGFADTLDALEQQGHDILPLEHPYNILVLMVENLQTLLDEKLDDLS